MNVIKINILTKICGGQDGAIFGSELFRFDTKGNCTVYDLSSVNGVAGTPSQIARFKLDRANEIVPHSNSVCFGSEFYAEGDDYPLLYSNIYNNYAKCEDKLMGVTCVYRIRREEDKFISDLVQLIEIGFCEDTELWRVSKEKHGERPYGNFLVDRDSGVFCAYVMRDEGLGTRYFKFSTPSVHCGENHPVFNVKTVTLTPSDIMEKFDCEFHRFIQGGTIYKGVLYSTEGFGGDRINRPAIRTVDLKTHKETYIDLTEYGITEEPEFIDFYNGTCYYSDAHGNFYSVEL